jgi:hypothetical protein
LHFWPGGFRCVEPPEWTPWLPFDTNNFLHREFDWET